jgi:hypothetical protein
MSHSQVSAILVVILLPACAIAQETPSADADREARIEFYINELTDKTVP